MHLCTSMLAGEGWGSVCGSGWAVQAHLLKRQSSHVSIGFLFRAGARKGISAMSHIYSDAWGASPRQSKGNAQETAGTMGCFRWNGAPDSHHFLFVVVFRLCVCTGEGIAYAYPNARMCACTDKRPSSEPVPLSTAPPACTCPPLW